jgi:hypothetical protein
VHTTFLFFLPLQPSPLFQKLEPCRAIELKKKFAGTQKERAESPKKSTSNATGDKATCAVPVSNGPKDQAKVDELTADVTQQVRHCSLPHYFRETGNTVLIISSSVKILYEHDAQVILSGV